MYFPNWTTGRLVDSLHSQLAPCNHFISYNLLLFSRTCSPRYNYPLLLNASLVFSRPEDRPTKFPYILKLIILLTLVARTYTLNAVRCTLVCNSIPDTFSSILDAVFQFFLLTGIIFCDILCIEVMHNEDYY